MIILEGYDGGGKSTLAKKFGLPITRLGGQPKTQEEENLLLISQLNNCGSIGVQDRATCVSQMIYGKKFADEKYHNYLSKMLKTNFCVFVYCRPPIDILMDFSRQTIEKYDDEEQVAYARENALLFISEYDNLMNRIPHVKYDYTRGGFDGEIAKLIRTQKNIFEWDEYVNR